MIYVIIYSTHSSCFLATINPIPRFGNMLGGTAVYMKTMVPTRPNEQISCKFGEADGVPRRINDELTVCVSPPSEREGAVVLRLQVGNRGALMSQYLYSKLNCILHCIRKRK